jgi:hypothetical protein
LIDTKDKFFCTMLHIDDEDLDPFEYRLLGHIRRRASGGEGSCFAAISSMARDTRMSERKVREVVKNLQRSGRIRVVTAPGCTQVILPLDMMDENIRRMKNLRHPTPGESATPCKNARGVDGGQPLAETPPPPCESATPPLAKMQGDPLQKRHPTPGESATQRNNQLRRNNNTNGGDADVVEFLAKDWEEGGCGVNLENLPRLSLAGFTLEHAKIMRAEAKRTAKRNPPGMVVRWLEEGPEGAKLTAYLKRESDKKERAARSEAQEARRRQQEAEELAKQQADQQRRAEAEAQVWAWFRGLPDDEQKRVVSRCKDRLPMLARGQPSATSFLWMGELAIERQAAMEVESA